MGETSVFALLSPSSRGLTTHTVHRALTVFWRWQKWFWEKLEITNWRENKITKWLLKLVLRSVALRTFKSINLHCVMKLEEKTARVHYFLYDHSGTLFNLVLFLFEMIAEPEKVIFTQGVKLHCSQAASFKLWWVRVGECEIVSFHYEKMTSDNRRFAPNIIYKSGIFGHMDIHL